MIVAIDGPAGAGKSTVSAALAERLGFQLIDTGALYRCVGLLARRQGIALDDADALAALAAGLDVRFEFVDGRNRVWCHGEDVSDAIRTSASSDAASKVSAVPAVREALLDLQRDLGRVRDSVMEGRDIGTVVFPDAEAKFFVTAALDERARRRLKDHRAAGRDVSFEAVCAEIRDRDYRDENRPVAPLRRADDAELVESTEMTFDEVVGAMEARVRAMRTA